MATVEVARQHDVDRAAEAARAAFPAWAATPPGERRALLNRAALEEFTELRWITVGGPEGRHYPI